jgi:hypothetical protein
LARVGQQLHDDDDDDDDNNNNNNNNNMESTRANSQNHPEQ